MKHLDFAVGTVFHTCTGQSWRCTDIGTRTIVAIELKPDLDEGWFNGPPFPVPEVVFDENDIGGLYRNDDEAIQDAIDEADNGAHPGYPHEVMKIMASARRAGDTFAYPRKELLKTDRVGDEGAILHPYAVERNGDEWCVLVYRPFVGDFQKLPETHFVRFRAASETDLSNQRDRRKS
jgi:hypothetical protein